MRIANISNTMNYPNRTSTNFKSCSFDFKQDLIKYYTDESIGVLEKAKKDFADSEYCDISIRPYSEGNSSLYTAIRLKTDKIPVEVKKKHSNISRKQNGLENWALVYYVPEKYPFLKMSTNDDEIDEYTFPTFPHSDECYKPEFNKIPQIRDIHGYTDDGIRAGLALAYTIEHNAKACIERQERINNLFNN